MIKDKLKVKRSSAGLGLFATKAIDKNCLVIEYTGEKITHKEANKREGRYLFTLNSKYVIDGKGRENIARYINHSCAPNCEAVIRNGKILINSIRKINPSEEITYDYGSEYVEEFIKPFGCKCSHCKK